MHYLEFLEAEARKNNSIVCFGVDPQISALPAHYAAWGIKGFVPFFQHIVKEMLGRKIGVGMFKPNEGYYVVHDEPRGADKHHHGSNVLDEILTIIEHAFPGAITNIDVKRGDIGPSSKNYAVQIFENWGAKAMTISGYMGDDSIAPFGEYCVNDDKLVYALCRTSNAGAISQGKKLANGLTIYEDMAQNIIGWAEKYPGMGAVVGGVSLHELKVLAETFAVTKTPILIPGAGGQGGSAAEIADVLREVGYPLYLARINSSSGITHPWAKKKLPAPENYAEVCVNEIEKMNTEIGPLF